MRQYMYRFEKLPTKLCIQCEETLKRSKASEARCWVWTYPGSFLSQNHLLLDVFFCRDLWFKSYTEQSQHGLPLCPFVVSLLANEPLSFSSSDPCCCCSPAARPARFGPGHPWSAGFDLTTGLDVRLISCWRLSGEDEHQEVLLSASTPTLIKIEARGTDCKGRILDVLGLYHITPIFLLSTRYRGVQSAQMFIDVRPGILCYSTVS